MKIKQPVLFFTGLSASGKSTIAEALSKRLSNANYPNYILDGDIIRNGLCKDLGFLKSDRSENIRRVAEVSNILSDAGMIVITALIAPSENDRDNARNIIGEKFNEIFIDTPLEVCENRDPKGLYKNARVGLIKNFTGISDNYDVPNTPELNIKTSELSVDESVEVLYDYVLKIL
jgi:adenylylsulfate kinase